MPESAQEKQIGGDHYTKYKIQPGTYCEVNHLDGYESSVVKYVTRHQDKGGIEDINKAIHCLELIKEIKYSNIQEEIKFERPMDQAIHDGDFKRASQCLKTECAKDKI